MKTYIVGFFGAGPAFTGKRLCDLDDVHVTRVRTKIAEFNNAKIKKSHPEKVR